MLSVTDTTYHMVQANGVDNTAVLNGFTISGGRANGTGSPNPKGGGILINNAYPIIEKCTITGNKATDGAGVAITSPVLTPVGSGSPTLFIDCDINSNDATNIGGGTYIELFMARFTGTTIISGNSHGSGCE